jgi:hypothetical protein
MSYFLSPCPLSLTKALAIAKRAKQKARALFLTSLLKLGLAVFGLVGGVAGLVGAGEEVAVFAGFLAASGLSEEEALAFLALKKGRRGFGGAF